LTLPGMPDRVFRQVTDINETLDIRTPPEESDSYA
jgi:hypothetical protein